MADDTTKVDPWILTVIIVMIMVFFGTFWAFGNMMDVQFEALQSEIRAVRTSTDQIKRDLTQLRISTPKPSAGAAAAEPAAAEETETGEAETGESE
jgi:hypothetical protein